jgi:uncharacterized membrane protein YidH (DUF202 family)
LLYYLRPFASRFHFKDYLTGLKVADLLRTGVELHFLSSKLKTLKTFLLVLTVLGSGAGIVTYLAQNSQKGGQTVRQMTTNNFILAGGVLIIVSAGFAILNSAMDAEKVRREEGKSDSLNVKPRRK